MYGFARNAFLVITLIVAAGAFVLAAMQVDAVRQSGDRMAVAIRFMAVLYPEIESTSTRFQLGGRLWPGIDAREFELRFGTTDLHPLRTSRDLQDAECHATFIYSSSEFSSYFAHGECVRDTENDAFLSLLERHRTWSEERITKELSRRGAEFGPTAKERLADRIFPGAVLAELIGDYAQMRQAAFEMPEREEGKIRLGGLGPRWELELFVPADERIRVIVTIEPFDGRLRSVVRMGRN